MSHHIFLVPGFFGFVNLGELVYFRHVRDLLPKLLEAHGICGRVHDVNTLPTASIRRRALALLEAIRAEAGEDDAGIHLVGHSTGGLDSRLLVTPHGNLANDVDAEPIAARVRTILTLSAPHYGTPLANFFTGIYGQQVLRVLSLATTYTMRFGPLPLTVLLELAALLTGMSPRFVPGAGMADRITNQLLDRFAPQRRGSVRGFIEDMSVDQGLMHQLTPEGTDAFSAATGDRPGVRYGSVVSAAAKAGARSLVNVGLDAYGQATHLLFSALQRVTGDFPERFTPELNEQQVRALRRGLGELPSRFDNDGIVPALSQVWGEVVHATWADHHDVLGHFDQKDHDPPHHDWVHSGSHFERNNFEHLWTDVARFIAGEPSVPWERRQRESLLGRLVRRGKRGAGSRRPY